MAPPTDDTADDDPGETPVPEGRMARLERWLAPRPAPVPANGKGGVPTKWSIDRLDARETLYCYVASGVALLFTIFIYVSETANKHYHPAKGQFSVATGLLVGLVITVALAVTTRIGRRALVGFVALFAFLGFNGSGGLVGIPFLILAGWLLYRSYKVQKEATAKMRADREAGGAAPTARSPRGSAASGRSAAEARAARKKAPTGPEANKRYTPKKPAPKAVPAPKQSRRERRAAQASD